MFVFLWFIFILPKLNAGIWMSLQAKRQCYEWIPNKALLINTKSKVKPMSCFLWSCISCCCRRPPWRLRLTKRHHRVVIRDRTTQASATETPTHITTDSCLLLCQRGIMCSSGENAFKMFFKILGKMYFSKFLM